MHLGGWLENDNKFKGDFHVMEILISHFIVEYKGCKCSFMSDLESFRYKCDVHSATRLLLKKAAFLKVVYEDDTQKHIRQ